MYLLLLLVISKACRYWARNLLWFLSGAEVQVIYAEIPVMDLGRGKELFWSDWCWRRVVVEVLYFTLRHMAAAVVASGLGAVHGTVHSSGQLAPVVLFPSFYKFEPLDNEGLCGGG